MKFGPVPLSEAEGGIAVHSIRKSGMVLKKGTRIGKGEIAALKARHADFSLLKSAKRWVHRDEERVPAKVRPQLARAREQHDGEDEALDRYLGTSARLDGLGVLREVLVPRAWFVLALLSLAPAVRPGQGEAR